MLWVSRRKHQSALATHLTKANRLPELKCFVNLPCTLFPTVFNVFLLRKRVITLSVAISLNIILQLGPTSLCGKSQLASLL